MSIVTYKANKLTPVKDKILVKNMVFTDRITTGGILLPSDDRKATGIRPRWAEVYAIGPDQKDVSVGEWILVSHGRWTRGMKFDVAGEEMIIQLVDNNDILLVSKDAQNDETFTTAVVGDNNQHRMTGSMHHHAGDIF